MEKSDNLKHKSYSSEVVNAKGDQQCCDPETYGGISY